MPEQYTITGTITSSYEADPVGIVTQVFNRDLSSMERHLGLAPQSLGDVSADLESLFPIRLTVEYFRANGP